ncbi:hypothetical protein MKY84_06290 [Chryseomicrobium sp. FSL W7-1435]|uniref:hypothetical protein n=1 Tax=Chryseomicrobium sp. FSL W7-1435 TaxID=2921704 RepID=UPI00315B2720
MERFYGIDALLVYLNQQGAHEFSETEILYLIEKRLIPHYISFGKRYSFQKEYIDSWLKLYKK